MINRGLSCPLLAGDQPASRCSSTTSQSATALESLHHRNAVKHKHNSQDRIGSSVSRDTVLSNQFEGKVNIMIVLSVKAKLNVLSILLDKLSVMGFSSKVTTWFNSYLSERVQRVEIDGVLSEETLVKNGVPQGSVLGPLLFLLYINDMQAVCDCNLFLYADDSALLISDKDVGRIQVNLAKELCKVRDWLSENKLMLHLGRTESILFGSKQNLNKVSKLSVGVGDCLISNRTSVNYLGCILDNDLSGVSMAMKVLGKVNARTKFLARHVSFLDKQLMK